MKSLIEFLKRPAVYYALIFAALFPILKGLNDIALSMVGFRIFHPIVFGLLIGYYVGRQFEKVKELGLAREESQKEVIALLKKKSDLESENRARFAFIANTSHELRTPLNAVIGFSEILIEDFESEKEKHSEKIDHLSRINKAGEYLLSLINDLLDLSKINSGKMEILTEKIDIDLLLSDLAAISDPLVKKKNNKLLIEHDGTGHIYADEMKLKQSLLNLISNAAKFTENGVITIASYSEAEHILLSVSDTGLGMTEQQLTCVFEEFRQAESSTSKHYGGTGLGLPLTKRFVELMNGTIKVESTLNKGSIFTISLPVSKSSI